MSDLFVVVIATLSVAEAATLMTAGATAGAAVLGAWTSWKRRRDDKDRAEAEEGTVMITQTQGANLVLDATVKALNTQVDREMARADRERERAERAERDLDEVRRKLRDCEGRRGLHSTK